LPQPRRGTEYEDRKEENMIGIVVSMAFVLGVLAVVAYALFEISPFAHHNERYHESGERQASPRLD
jgi:hypothetical protein